MRKLEQRTHWFVIEDETNEILSGFWPTKEQAELALNGNFGEALSRSNPSRTNQLIQDHNQEPATVDQPNGTGIKPPMQKGDN